VSSIEKKDGEKGRWGDREIYFKFIAGCRSQNAEGKFKKYR